MSNDSTSGPSARVYRLLTSVQHNTNFIHGTSLLGVLLSVHVLLLACDLLRRYFYMLRGIRNCLLLRPPLPLYCPQLTRAKDILPGNNTKTMGLAYELVQEVLWWGEGYLEDAEERTYLV